MITDILSGDRLGPGDSEGYPGTGEGLSASIYKKTGSVRTPYVVNRAPHSKQGKVAGLVAFAKPEADGGAEPT